MTKIHNKAQRAAWLHRRAAATYFYSGIWPERREPRLVLVEDGKARPSRDLSSSLKRRLNHAI